MAQAGIPQSHVDLFKKKAFAHLVTLMPNGNPQSTPVWIDYDGKNVVINTAEGRLKDKNMQRDGRVLTSGTTIRGAFALRKPRRRALAAAGRVLRVRHAPHQHHAPPASS